MIECKKLIEDLKPYLINNSIHKNDLAEVIANQPRVNTWISVEDMLPENAERYKGRKVIDVLVTTEKGLVTKVQRQCYRGSWSWGRIFSRVVAWMPLPKPYKED